MLDCYFVLIDGRVTRKLFVDIMPCNNLLIYITCTYLPKPIEYPLFFFLFASKLETKSYFELPGEQVRSFVKSDFILFPMPAPFLSYFGSSPA